MRYAFTICFCFIFWAGSAQKEFSKERLYRELGLLAEQKNFFGLKEQLISHKPKIDKEVYFYYWALTENAFSHFGESNAAIESFFENAGSMKNDTLFKEILLIRQLNMVNLFRYKDAYETNRYILENFTPVCTPDELDDLENTAKIWKALENTGKQIIHKTADTRVQLSRDRAKLANIPVTISGKKKDFIFDTGANFSVIQRSVALEMGCEIIPAQFEVGAITGAKVKSDLAVAKELYLGDIRCENVIFLVFDDKDLSFPEADYAIKGIIGFPVIRSLDEIHLNKQDQLFIPKIAEPSVRSNMVLNGFMPVVQVIHDGDILQFTFDTGAVETSLNVAYYNKYRRKVERKGTRKTLKSGGAGGMVEFEGYLLPKITLEVATSEATIRDVQVQIEKVGETDADFAGNLGQDFIKQFDEMIINFQYSAIQFK